MSERPFAAPPAMRMPTPSEGRPLPGWVFDVTALAVAWMLGVALWRAGANLDPTARDQVHDLSLAVRIREGVALSDGNRHPLFPALLAPFAGRDPAFQTRALGIGVVVTMLSLLAVYGAAAAVFSRRIAVAAALGLLIEFFRQGRRICPEPLVAGLLVVGVALLSRSRAGQHPARWTLAGGAMLGLAWLAKGSATLALLAAVAYTLTSGVGRARRLGLLLVGFVAIAWPLMAWNVSQSHPPLYNVNSAHVMWEDAWDGDLDRRSTATLSSWWAGHSLADGAARLGRGLVTQRGIEWVYGALVVLGAAAFLRRRRRPDSQGGPTLQAGRAWASLAIWNGAIWLLAFAWYAPIVSSRRLLFPVFPVLLPPVLATVAPRVRSLLPAFVVRWSDAVRARALGLGVFSLVFVFGLGAHVASGPVRPGSPDPIHPAYVDAAQAITRHCPVGSRILVRPSRTYPPDWLLVGRVSYVELPSAVPDAGLAAWLVANVDFVLENEGLAASRPTVEAAWRSVLASRPGRRRAEPTWSSDIRQGAGAFQLRLIDIRPP